MDSTWQKEYTSKEYPSLTGNLKADVVIVGGGMCGITLAYLLSKAGKKVIVLEKDTLGTSISSITTAFLSTDIDTDLHDLVRTIGEDLARKVWYSHREATDKIEEIIKEENISCEFSRVDEYLYATTKKGYETFKKEAKWAQEFGISIDTGTGTLPFKNEGYIVLYNQAKFEPLKYASALREKARSYGAEFFEHSEVTEIEGDTMVIAKTLRGSVEAPYVAIATYNPFIRLPELFLTKGMYISYVYELKIPKGILVPGLYLDDNNPYHYFRIDKGEMYDRMIIGGEDHRKEIPLDKEKNFSALLSYIQKTFPQFTYSIQSRWWGEILESSDGLAWIGQYDTKHSNRFVATAFSGNGMTYSMIAAEIISRTILGKENPYKEVYDAMRPLRRRSLIIKARDYIGEFIHGALKNIFHQK